MLCFRTSFLSMEALTHIVFTSGATECNNISDKDVMHLYKEKKKHDDTIITSTSCANDDTIITPTARANHDVIITPTPRALELGRVLIAADTGKSRCLVLPKNCAEISIYTYVTT
ncbi:hypothetical protein Tco_1319748 [Tanacetum coccineum]